MNTTLLNNAITTRTYNSSCFAPSLYFRSFKILKISIVPLIIKYEAIRNMTGLFLSGSRIVTQKERGGTCTVVYECVTIVVEMNHFSFFLFEFRLLNFGAVYYVIVHTPVAQNSIYFQIKLELQPPRMRFHIPCERSRRERSIGICVGTCIHKIVLW